METQSPPWTWEEVGAGAHLNARERSAITGLLDQVLACNAGMVSSTATAEEGNLVFSATVVLIGEVPVAHIIRLGADGYETVVAVAKR